MPTMVTFRAGRVALISLLAGLATACSREQQDWRSAEGADSTEAWQRFLDQHPDSEFAGQARTRITQLDEQRDFQFADRAGTVEAYREFLAHHPSGKWAEHARIRIEAFSLGSAPRISPLTPEQAAAFGGSGVHALRLATATTQDAPIGAIESAAVPAEGVAEGAAEGADKPDAGWAVPGEAAQAETDTVVRPVSANETAVDTRYGVQLGAFGSEASADREWRRLRGRFGTELGNLSPRIVVAETDSGQLYRLQAPAAGEAQARAICDSLKEQDQACVPVVTR
jgi:cell division septation protein DedD